MCTSVGIIDRGQLLRAGSIRDIEVSLRAGAVLQVDLLGDETTIAGAETWLSNAPHVGDVLHGDVAAGLATRLEIPFDGDANDQAELLRSLIAAGYRVTGFHQATSDLEEIFLKVTGQDEEEGAA